jgi:hypothetical protein
VTVTVSATFDVGAEELWHLIGDFYDVAGWMPGIAASIPHRDDRIREVRVAGSSEPMLERLADDGPMRQRYTLVSGPLPVRNYTASLEAAATARTQTTVSWTATFLPTTTEAAARAAVEGVFHGALGNLAKLLSRRATAATTSEVFAAILDELTPRGVSEQAMFGQRGLIAEGHLFATTFHSGFAVRLLAGTPEFDAAISIDGARVWNPTRREQPFRDWVELPGEHVEVWADYALAALHRSATGRHRR